MNNIEKILFYPFIKPLVVLTVIWKFLSPILPAKLYLLVLYRLRFGYWMDLDNPSTFNEKLQWLKLYDRQSVYIKLVDKYEGKSLIGEVIGSEHIIPTLGVWDNVDDIDFETLPNQFVLKCTHDSGGLVICKDKDNLDKSKAKRKLKKCLANNYYNEGKEWPYKHVKKKIIAEKYLKDTSNKDNDLRDYKFFCFNGTVEFFKIDFGRFVEHHANYYDRKGNLLPFGEVSCPPKEIDMPMPLNLDKMISMAERIAHNYPFMRVDFYDVEGNIFWGECTLYPASGFGAFTPSVWDGEIGKLVKLPLNN